EGLHDALVGPHLVEGAIEGVLLLAFDVDEPVAATGACVPMVDPRAGRGGSHPLGEELRLDVGPEDPLRRRVELARDPDGRQLGVDVDVCLVFRRGDHDAAPWWRWRVVWSSSAPSMSMAARTASRRRYRSS